MAFFVCPDNTGRCAKYNSHGGMYSETRKYLKDLLESNVTELDSSQIYIICYIQSCLSQRMSENTNEQGKTQQGGSQWAEIIGQLVDRMTGKGASATYDFDNLVIDIPKAQGPGGRDMGAAQWTINGKVTIAWEAHKTSDEARPRASVSTVT
jgi:hypothetical protein